jgi:hypothetical protein
MVNRRRASNAIRTGGRHWPVLTLLLALILVGHDAVMISPRAHTHPESASSSHHRMLHPVGTSMASTAWVIPFGQSASQCPVLRVARTPSSLTLEADADNGPDPVGRCKLVSRDQAAPDKPIAPLPAGTRRALLQVYLM